MCPLCGNTCLTLNTMTKNITSIFKMGKKVIFIRIDPLEFPQYIIKIRGKLFVAGDFICSVKGQNVTIIHYNGEDENLTIPSKINNFSVKAIAASAFQNCKSLTSVTVPDSVKKIGIYAFQNCINLKYVKLSNSIKKIEEYTFSECDLSSIELPNSIRELGKNAFEWCENLNSVIIPDSVVSIGECSFFMCTRLTSMILCGATRIGKNAVPIHTKIIRQGRNK